MDDQVLSRRRFLTSAGLGVAGMAGIGDAAGSNTSDSEFAAVSPASPHPSASATSGLVDLATLKALHIWDGHCHLMGFEGASPGERMQNMLRYADRMGIERMCVFLGMEFTFHAGAEAMRKQNDEVMEAVKHSNGRALGYAFMDPYYADDCLEELNRCVRDGPMVGLKFEFDTPALANSPVLDPIIECAGELKAVVLHHTYIKTTGNMLGESTPVELAELARRHPSTTIICGHTGATWELGIPPLRRLKNVYADLCGSDPTSGFTEMAVRELGADRVMYGSDIGGRGFASQLAKVMGAKIPLSARPLIMGGNLRRVLEPILTAKGVRV
jgi:uncharacterized protein